MKTPLTDTPDAMRVRLAQLHESGDLVSMSPPQPARGRPGEVTVFVELRSTVATRPDPGLARPAPRARWWWLWRLPQWARWTLLGTGVAIVGLASWLVVEAVLWLWDHRYLILGALVVALVAVVVLSRTRPGRRAVVALWDGGPARWFDERP